MLSSTTDTSTLLPRSAEPERRERRFFMGMAWVIAATFILGFGSFALRGLVPQPTPLYVHVHGAIFFAWVALYTAQSTLIASGQARIHRRLGWVSLILLPLMVVAAVNITVQSVIHNRVPPIFTDSIFLALATMELLVFVPMTVAALVLRKRSDWHRRLMLGAMISMLIPALGRLLPMPLLGEMGHFAVMGIQLLYVLAAMAFDLRLQSRIHPAYSVILVAILLETLLVGPLGLSPAYIELANSLKSS